MPATTKCLEIRINSVQDAKACVQHHERISHRIKTGGFDAVELLVAQEVERQVEQFLAGLFRVRTFRAQVKTKDGNTLMLLPVYRPSRTEMGMPQTVRKLEPPVAPDVPSVQIPKRRGKPPKVKAVA